MSALPGRILGPDLPIHTTFETPGIYKLWVKFRLDDDRVITVPFTVRAC